MCLVLYLGTEAEPPLVAPQDFSLIDADDPAWPSKVIPFSVEELTPHNEVVTKHFTTPFVRYSGSYEGCGCGFNSCRVPEWEEEPDELDHGDRAGRRSRELLRHYVEINRVSELYACWSGDEAEHPTAHIEIKPGQITDWSFECPERGMLRIDWG